MIGLGVALGGEFGIGGTFADLATFRKGMTNE